MAEASGRRERKKEQTRQHIAETARRLFAARGFEAVRVAEIAREADVAEQTVYNYFPSKEDLVYWRLESFEEGLLAAVRGRAEDQGVADAFGGWLLSQRGMLQEAEISAELVGLTRMIHGSPALRARERQIFAGSTDALARVIAEGAGADEGDIRPWVAANALVGVHRALVGFARERILAGARNPQLAEDVRAEALRALAALREGFAGLG